MERIITRTKKRTTCWWMRLPSRNEQVVKGATVPGKNVSENDGYRKNQTITTAYLLYDRQLLFFTGINYSYSM